MFSNVKVSFDINTEAIEYPVLIHEELKPIRIMVRERIIENSKPIMKDVEVLNIQGVIIPLTHEDKRIDNSEFSDCKFKIYTTDDVSIIIKEQDLNRYIVDIYDKVKYTIKGSKINNNQLSYIVLYIKDYK